METHVGIFLVDPKTGQVIFDSLQNSLPEAIEYMREADEAWFTLPVHTPLEAKEAPKKPAKAAKTKNGND